MKDLEIVESQLEVGQVKSITTNGGRTVELIELLLGDTTKAQMYVDREKNMMQLVVKDTDLALPSLECYVDASTLRDLIVSLKNMYNEVNVKTEGE